MSKYKSKTIRFPKVYVDYIDKLVEEENKKDRKRDTNFNTFVIEKLEENLLKDIKLND